MKFKIAIPSAVLVAFLACNKEPQPTSPPSGGEPVADGQDAPAEGADDGEVPSGEFDDMNDEDRAKFMSKVVLPQMGGLFKGHNGERFGEFKCQTCHGENAKERGFEMPSDSIYPLAKQDTIKKASEYDAEMTKFMSEQVVPKMAGLLGEEPYNPETGKGFGCFSCHPTE